MRKSRINSRLSKPLVLSAKSRALHICELYSISKNHAPKWGVNVSIGSAISGLLMHCGPSTILRLVVPIVVNAIQAMVRAWLGSHVIKKRSKAVLPSFANQNSPATIPRKVGISRIKASFFNAAPRAILRCVPKSMRFTSEASAAFGVSAFKVRAINDGLFPAITIAYPSQLVTFVRSLRLDDKHGKSLPNQVNLFHGDNYAII